MVVPEELVVAVGEEVELVVVWEGGQAMEVDLVQVVA